MGRPELQAAKVPVTFPEKTMIDEPMEIDGTIYQVTCVSMGNPHCVIFMDEDVRQLDLEELGPKFENHVIFPKRTNTEFCNLLDKQHIRMRVWERGSGETLACGTGACATAVAAVLNGYTDNKVELQLRGGNLLIEYDRDAEEVYMTGPATTVFEGEIDLPENWEDDTIRIYHPKR
jgi:diaminopimelate epimerase